MTLPDQFKKPEDCIEKLTTFDFLKDWCIYYLLMWIDLYVNKTYINW